MKVRVREQDQRLVESGITATAAERLASRRVDHPKARRGQALTELGIVVALFVLVTLGIVEFGYHFLALHVVTQATSAGARAASLIQHVCGPYSSAQVAQIDSIVRNQVGGAATLDAAGTGVTLTETGCGAGSIPQVTVTVTGSIPRIFGLMGSTAIHFTRTETFRDEGQAS